MSVLPSLSLLFPPFLLREQSSEPERLTEKQVGIQGNLKFSPLPD